jgi:hypothetical protein
MTQQKGALWLVDRAFINARFWDNKKKRLGVTMITRMKKGLSVDSTVRDAGHRCYENIRKTVKNY